MEKNKMKTILFTVISIGLITIIGTYAWLSYRSNSTAMVLTIGEINKIRITLKPYQISKSISPQVTYETDNENDYVQVEAINNSSQPGKIILYFDIENIDTQLQQDSNFKYTIEKSTDGTTYSELKSGNFRNIDNNRLQILLEDLPNNTTYNYKVYIWLDGSNSGQGSSITGKSFKGNLYADITEEEYCKNNNITSFSECLIRNDSKTDLPNALTKISNRSINMDFNEIAPIRIETNNSGLYKGEDDYTTYSGSTPTNNFTYYYRGAVNNNWVSFGGFLWRIVRINGDGSIRMIYSGLASKSNHTGTNAQIKTASFGDTSSKTTTTTDVTGLTNDTITTTYSNGTYGTTYVGYMYNPSKEIATHPNKLIGSANTQTGGYKLNYFPTFTNISTITNYYFFKNFNPSTDCFTGSGTDETGACTLKCKSLGNDGDTGIDCVRSNWNTLATTTGNYSTTDPGVYSTSQYIYKSDYKYTCWEYGTAVTHANSNNTTSVYITCPIVSEIIGTVAKRPTEAKVKYHGLFSQNVSTSNSNIKDSNIKTQVDSWYASNILNKNDGNSHSLESYLSDEIFCNDRTSNSNAFPLTTSGDSYIYGAYTRNKTNKLPNFKCPNANNDGFTLKTSGASSSVTPSGNGNKMLNYPVGLITADEAVYAGGKFSKSNHKYYLDVGTYYWTMSPSYFHSLDAYAYVWFVFPAGSLSYNRVAAAYGVRPVLNLKSDVLYSNGTGTEADPYIITIQ